MASFDIHNSTLLPLAAGLFLLLVLNYAKSRAPSRGTLPLPPGPKPLPLIGNAIGIPKEFQWFTFQRLSEKYGDVVHLKFLGQSMIILGSCEAIFDLLDKRSSIYSDRSQSIMVSLTGWEWDFGLMPYGQRWRRTRRTFHQFFNQGAISNFQSVQVFESRRFLRNLLADPDHFVRHIRFVGFTSMFAAIIMKIAYGIDLSDSDDKYTTIANRALVGFVEGLVPGKYLVEFVPLLRYIPSWFPGAGLRRQAAIWHADATALREVPFAVAKDIYKRGAAGSSPSITSELLEKISHLEGVAAVEEEQIAKDAMGVAYAAGADTTFSTIQWFFLAMILYPEVQKRAQAELDAVVGAGRLPEFGDRESLPYVNAVALECFRWQTVLPLSIPHRALEDDEYKGYFIPKGSLVIPNIWAITHDPTIYPGPHKFNPERFLKGEKLDPEVRDPRTLVFGFGRRICTGRHLADGSLFINVASVLHAYNITFALDEEGRPIEPKPVMTSGLISYPVPFRFAIKPRSAAAEALIRGGVDPAENIPA